MNKDRIKFKSPKFNILIESTQIKFKPTKNVGYFDI